MKRRIFEAELRIPRPLAEVFPFFAAAENLQEITPPWLRFEVVTPAPIAMRMGAKIDYRLRVHGLPLRWQSEITVWEPPHRFVDEQRRGPYRLWHHEHTFEEKDGVTIARDQVEYAIWFDFLLHALFVGPDVKRIFAYRQAKLRERFSA